ncbi:MAPEG family protein [Roseobacter sp. YSTF-M11]|uniref:MAPEG family protein n=1 Tax=Roseobacter insulae TaxID=2859783 RepID=A0A9X1K309_9RHOB|nr:MAPEG family protein [Roseobacter insulae]MBW4709093.1 MAPEG family protein [Roseobacter insulae]
MLEAPQITLFFTAIFVLVSVPMSIMVGLRRAKTGIMLLHGDDEDLLKRMRAHGNFTEYVPLALLALAGAEITGAPGWFVMVCGGVLLLARLIHYAALRRSATSGGRLVGAAMTSLVMTVLAATILAQLAGMV